MWDYNFEQWRTWNAPAGMPPRMCAHSWVPYGLEGLPDRDIFWELDRCLVCDYPRYRRLPPVTGL